MGIAESIALGSINYIFFSESRMKMRTIACLVCAWVGFFAQQAYATDYIITSATIGILSQSLTTSGAHAVVMVSGTNTASSSCSNIFYIEFDDKELYAAAMTAAALGKTVTMKVKSGQSARYIDPQGTHYCQVVQIIFQ
jgi:hypothetical protein